MVDVDPPVGSGLPRIGTLTYTPGALWHGYDAVTFRVSDDFVSSNEATVHFVVNPVNNPPVLACPTAAEVQRLASAGDSSAAAAARASAARAHPLCAAAVDGSGWLKPQPAEPVLYAHAVVGGYEFHPVLTH
jgi:hypothetical protein